jgi:hypothetical protein
MTHYLQVQHPSGTRERREEAKSQLLACCCAAQFDLDRVKVRPDLLLSGIRPVMGFE